jgi:hypothetical protein
LQKFSTLFSIPHPIFSSSLFFSYGLVKRLRYTVPTFVSLFPVAHATFLFHKRRRLIGERGLKPAPADRGPLCDCVKSILGHPRQISAAARDCPSRIDNF